MFTCIRPVLLMLSFVPDVRDRPSEVNDASSSNVGPEVFRLFTLLLCPEAWL
jgi:hypothetical protein